MSHEDLLMPGAAMAQLDKLMMAAQCQWPPLIGLPTPKSKRVYWDARFKLKARLQTICAKCGKKISHIFKDHNFNTLLPHLNPSGEPMY